MANLIASAASKEALEAIINRYYYSSHYTITDDNRVYNGKLGECLTGVKVEIKKGRWRFVMV